MPDIQRPNHKIFYFLPNTLTALNIACGFMALIMAIKNEFHSSCMMLVLAGLFDMMDGRVARLTSTSSSFGEQFDSMSDLISFGMSPAILYYQRFLYDQGRLGLMLSFLFLLMGAMRLARFNANIDRVSSDYFQGLPIPLGAMSLIGLVLFSLQFEFILSYRLFAIAHIVFYSFLMISSIPFPSFKNSSWVKKYRKQTFLLMLAVACLFFIYQEVMMIAIVTFYVLSCFCYYLLNYSRFQGVFQFDQDH